MNNTLHPPRTQQQRITLLCIWLLFSGFLILPFPSLQAAPLPTSTSPSPVSNPDHIDWIQHHPNIVVGVQQDWKPFDFAGHPPSMAQGMVQDLLTEALDQYPLSITYRTADWNTLLGEFIRGEIDVLPAINKTPERQKLALFTDPYINLYQYFFAHTDARAALKANLAGSTLAIPHGYGIITQVQERYPELRILPVNSVEEAIHAVLSRQAELLLDIYSVLNVQLKEMGIHSIQPVRPFDTLALRMAISPRHPVLQDIIQTALNQVPPARIEHLTRKWMPLQQKPGFVPLDKEELTWLQQHPDVSITSRIHWLPLASQSHNTISGIAGDYLNRMAQYLQVHFKQSSSNTPQALLIDLNQSGIPDNYQLTADFGEYPLAIITPWNNVPGLSIDQLPINTLVSIRDSSYLKRIQQQHPQLSVETRVNGSEVLRALLSGSHSVAVMPAAEAYYYMKHEKYPHLSLATLPDSIHAVLVIHKDYPVLIDTLSRSYTQLTAADKTAIAHAWQSHQTPEKINYTAFLQLLLLLCGIAAIIMYWNRRLRHEISHREAIEFAVRKERDNFLALFQQAAEGNLIFQDNRCVDANPAAVALFGHTSTVSLKHRTLEELIATPQPSPQLYSSIQAAFTECATQGRSQLEFQLFPLMKNSVWVDASLTGIHYLKKPSVYLVCRNISQQKQLSQKLSEARQAAEAGNKAKSDFIARVSHEIRTPLNVIIGSTRLLKEHHQDPDLVQDKSISIQRAAERLLRQIDDVLNFSRLEANQMPLYKEPVNLVEALAENTEFFSDMASKKYLLLDFHSDPELEALTFMLDLPRLNQILTNLVTNALKYTREGHIIIRAQLDQLDSINQCADISISIEDTGDGIAPAEQQRIFENFVRTAQSENEQQEGTGLGLAISNKLAQLMNGALHLESQPGVGSVFTLRLARVALTDEHDSSIKHSPERSKHDQLLIKQARRSTQSQAIALPEPEIPTELPSWITHLSTPDRRALLPAFQQHISPSLARLGHNHNLDTAHALADVLASLDGYCDGHFQDMALQLNKALKTCDITVIERIKKELQHIEAYIEGKGEDQEIAAGEK